MSETMTTMVLERAGEGLRASTRAVPEPGPGRILIRVHACVVCRTDLHVVDGELPDPMVPMVPMVPGHEVVGEVDAIGRRLTSGNRLAL